jgi:putative (di)nucleoside polyphosphate hydrolase
MVNDNSKCGYRPCVGIMVVNAAGQVWIGRRADAPGEPEGRGTWWQMPQGGIDGIEDPRAAALRELREETGIRTVEVIAEMPRWLSYDLPPHLVGKAWGGRWRGQRQKWFLMRFLGADAEVNVAPAAEHQIEFDTWRWAPISELMELIVPFKREVYRAVVNEFAPLATPIDDGTPRPAE